MILEREIVMDIPIRVAKELWKDYPDALEELEGWEIVYCDTSWDEAGKATLIPISLSDGNGGIGCSVTRPFRIRVDLGIVAEYDRLLEECVEKMEDKFMEECLARAEDILDERYDIYNISCYTKGLIPSVTSMAVALFQSGIDQAIAAREKEDSKASGNTGLQG